MKDGMNADEAAEAVQPPPESPESDSDESSNLHDEEDPGNPHKLRKCSISLKRMGYIEKAVKKGCKSILFRYYKSSTVPKLIP